MKAGRLVVPVVILINLFLLFSGTGLQGDSLSRFLLEKYTFISINSSPPQYSFLPFNITADIYTGDFPFILSYDPDDSGVTLFTGLPRFFPLYIGMGRYSEIGYIDLYSRLALIRSLGIGSKSTAKPFKSTPYLFLSSKIYNLAFGGNIFLDGSFAFTGGYFLKDFGISFTMKNTDYFKTDFTFPLFRGLAFRLSGIIDRGIPMVQFGLGNYRTEFSDNDYSFGASYRHAAHRGSIQLFPENSYRAFQYAKSRAFYDYIEFDVYKTRDNHYVVVHDPILLRYTGEFKRVRNSTLTELKERDFGKFLKKQFRGTRILTLEELAEELKGTNKGLIIEIKGIGTKERDTIDFLEEVKRVFDRTGNRNITFLAMNPAIVRYLKKHSRKRVAYLFPILCFNSFLPQLLEPEITYHLRETGADMIFFYTNLLDNRKEIERLSEKLGFDFAFWNFHDVIYVKNRVIK